MGDVVRPRGVTYNVTCHQWFTNGLSSILTFPTIWVHMWSVSHVSFHASNGNDGHCSAVSPRLVLLVLSIVFFSCLSLLSQVSSLEGRHTPPSLLLQGQEATRPAPRNRDTRPH